MPTIFELKERSGAKLFASFIGKSKIRKNTRAYKMIEWATMITVRNGLGVIHGGFPGGAMSAVNNIANLIISERSLALECNIAVPQVQFDHLPRVAEAVFTDPAIDSFERLRLILSAEIIIVCPLAGPGTLSELATAFSENIYCQSYNRPVKPKPIIFLQALGGIDWKLFLIDNNSILSLDKDLDSYSWLNFVDSKTSFHELILSLKNDLLSQS